MKTAVIFLMVLSCLVFAGRNARFDNLADRTWVNVCPFEGYIIAGTAHGAGEVPWAYDANSRVLVRVGGCTSIYNNAIVFFDLGTETWEMAWPYDESAPTDRPPCGCNRGVCYDPHTKHVWTVGGATSGCGGQYGLWKGDMAARSWTHLLDRQGAQAHIVADTDAKKIIFYYWESSGVKHCKIHDPATGNTTAVPPMPDTTQVEGVYYPVQYWYGLEYMPVMNGTMIVGQHKVDVARGYPQEEWFTWLLNTGTGTWVDLKATGLPASYGRCILSYDPVSQVMLLMIRDQGLYEYDDSTNHWSRITTSNDPVGQSSEMFEYDSEHNVHVYSQLYPQSRVWAFRYSNGTVVEGEIIGSTLGPAPSLHCYPNPFSASTFIFHSLKSPSVLSIFNPEGSLVRRLTAPQWKGIDEQGRSVPNGTYMIRLKAGDKTLCKKVMVIR
jgi:hypothetical protein